MYDSYYMEGSELTEVSYEKDLGVWISADTVPKLSLLPAAVRFASGEVDVRGDWAVSPPTDLAVRTRSRRYQITLAK